MVFSIAACFRIGGGRRRRPLGVLACVATLIGLLAGMPAYAANYALELVSPRAAGTSPAAGFASIPAGHRIFKAYPGIPYSIRGVAIGGSWPYTWSLTNAPAGMTIDAATGEITWTNPQSNVTPTVAVTDAEGTVRSSSWNITVTREGFRFVDSVNGSATGTGTIESPWRDLLQIKTSSAPGQMVYFRNGSYSHDGISRGSVGGGWERVEFYGSQNAMTWMAYPGESPSIDFGYQAGVANSAAIRFHSTAAYPIYLEGLEGHSFLNIGFQVISGTSDFSVFRNLTLRDMIQGQDGQNPAGILFTSNYADATQYAAVQGCEFHNMNGGGGLKFYSHKKTVIEGNLFRDSDSGFDLKAHVPRFDVRDNVFQNIRNYVLFGNMNTSGSGEPASGEIRYNNVNTANSYLALDLNQDGQAAEIFVYRNTLVGRVRVRNVDSADGPFRFANNVIVNDDAGSPSGSHITLESVSDSSRITRSDDLAGYPRDGVVDSSGFLTSEYARFIGSHGHQIGARVAAPLPPSSVRIE